MNTLSYIDTNIETIKVGNVYCFGQLWDGSGDGEELLESKCIAINEEVVVDFEIVTRDTKSILDAIVKVISLSSL